MNSPGFTWITYILVSMVSINSNKCKSIPFIDPMSLNSHNSLILHNSVLQDNSRVAVFEYIFMYKYNDLEMYQWKNIQEFACLITVNMTCLWKIVAAK